MPNDQEFRVHSYGRSFCLRASSDVDRSEWVFALQLVTKDAMVRLVFSCLELSDTKVYEP